MSFGLALNLKRVEQFHIFLILTVLMDINLKFVNQD